MAESDLLDLPPWKDSTGSHHDLREATVDDVYVDGRSRGKAIAAAGVSERVMDAMVERSDEHHKSEGSHEHGHAH